MAMRPSPQAAETGRLNGRPAIRLAALDLDQTLVGPDLNLRPRVKEAVARTLARGVAVTIVTGRGIGITGRYAAELGLTAPIICFQGGLVYDYQAQRVLHEVRLDPTVIPIVAQLAEQHGWNLQFETTTKSYLPRVSGHPQELLDLLRLAGWRRVDNFATDLSGWHLRDTSLNRHRQFSGARARRLASPSRPGCACASGESLRPGRPLQPRAPDG